MPYTRNAQQTDQLITAGSNQDPCLTSFERTPLLDWLNGLQGVEYLQKVNDETPTQLFFAFEAYNANGDSIGHHRGELPCPETCLPGHPIIPDFTKFEPEDIRNVLNARQDVSHLCLHKCVVGQNQNSYMIYPHNGTTHLRNLIALVSIVA